MFLNQHNLLPVDGAAYYLPDFMDKNLADEYFNYFLQNIPWQHDQVIMFGKKITTKRQVAWYGDEGSNYTYAKVHKIPIPWNNTLLQLKKHIETLCHQNFNAVLMNLYANGHEGMTWHSDNEKELDPTGIIASVSLGAERLFQFKHKNKEFALSCSLAHGSLLLMDQHSQSFWRHQLPLSKRILEPRINLTFRRIIKSNA